MKHYFKYGSGYVNINGEYLCLTNSNSWQKAQGLKETKSSRLIKQKKIFIWSIYLLFIGFSTYIYSYITLIILTALLGVNNIFGKSFKAFKIHQDKLEKIERLNKDVVLYYFYNETNELKSILLKKVSNEDYKYLIEFLTKDI